MAWYVVECLEKILSLTTYRVEAASAGEAEQAFRNGRGNYQSSKAVGHPDDEFVKILGVREADESPVAARPAASPPPRRRDVPIEGITCVCDDCERTFTLTSDRDHDPDNKVTHLRVASCESGGVYSVKVKCPHCGTVHKLY